MNDMYVLIEVTTQRSTMGTTEPRYRFWQGTFEEVLYQKKLEEDDRRRKQEEIKRRSPNKRGLNQSNVDVKYLYAPIPSCSTRIQELQSRLGIIQEAA